MKNIDKVLEEARAEIMPFNSWEFLPKESGEAFAAFVVYRDLGFDRSIKKAIEKVSDNSNSFCAYSKSYGSWRKWAVDYRWKERAADFDRYNEQLKQTENRKTIEAQAEKHREVTGKMLDVAIKKLDTMNPDDLSPSGVVEFVQVAVKTDIDGAGFILPNGKTEVKQGKLNFVSDFQGL